MSSFLYKQFNDLEWSCRWIGIGKTTSDYEHLALSEINGSLVHFGVLGEYVSKSGQSGHGFDNSQCNGKNLIQYRTRLTA